MAHLVAQDSAAIFSPSVARIAASTARDWSYVDSWLSSKFHGRPMPSFERNQDTLKVLLALANANESADEERQLLAKTEAAALTELTNSQTKQSEQTSKDSVQSTSQVRESLLGIIEQDLSKEGHAALDAMAKMALKLCIAYPEPEDLGRRMVGLQSDTFAAEQMRARAEIIHRHIEDETKRMEEYLNRLQGSDYKPAPGLAKQNLDTQRQVNTTAARIPELQERAVGLARTISSSHPTVDDIAREEQEYLSILTEKKELDRQMASFHGLPSNTDMARSELESLRGQLHSITSRRDEVFEGLVERESPIKRRR